MARLIAAIDQGTTSTRCILFDVAGTPVASSQLEHRQIFPQPGWVEHDPLEIWRRTGDVIRGAMGKAGARAEDIVGIGITNQRETTVVWDRRTGQPLTHAIVWQDTRTRDLCNQLAVDGGQDRFRSRTGLPLATYFSGPKLRWMLDNVKGLRKAAERGEAIFGTIDSWLIWNLTGGPDGGAHVTDVTNAGRTMLMDLQTLDWSEPLLEAIGIPRNMLPQIVPSLDQKAWGVTRRDGPFGGEIPVCGCLGDQHAAMLGQTCFAPGESKNTYGTGCFMLLHTGQQPVVSNHGLLTTVAYKLGDELACYALEGSVAVAGSLVQWLRDNLGLIGDSSEIEALARGAADNGGVYFVPAFAGLFAPYWRSDARGTIVGLTGFANRSHIARAALESTAFQTLDVLDAMRRDCQQSLKVLRVDGGMAGNDLLMQFQADILGVPVVRPKVPETTALGAAYAAGLATGFWKNTDDLRKNWKADKQWEPKMSESDRNRLHERWQQAVQRSLGWES